MQWFGILEDRIHTRVDLQLERARTKLLNGIDPAGVSIPALPLALSHLSNSEEFNNSLTREELQRITSQTLVSRCVPCFAGMMKGNNMYDSYYCNLLFAKLSPLSEEDTGARRTHTCS